MGGLDDSGLRLAELVAAFTFAVDLGLGQPMEHVLRSWLIAARLGDHVGVKRDQRATLFYVATLAWVGCVADTPELSAWFGDDIAYRHDGYALDQKGAPMMAFMLGHAGAGRPLTQRVRTAVSLMASGRGAIERVIQSHCLVTSTMADRLGLGPQVGDPLNQFFTRWDGTGVPIGMAGQAIALPMRLYQLADVMEVMQRVKGTPDAIAVARERSGTQFDPELVEAFATVADDVLGDPVIDTDWQMLIADEPSLRPRLSDGEVDAALEAFGDFTDLRSRWRAGHSRRVADLVSSAGTHVGLPETETVALRRAGLLHDIGLHGIPATILDKEGRLSRSEWERVRLHAYYTERVLSRPPLLARLGAIASLTNERSDGSGYHRGLNASAIPIGGKLLAASCAYCAMTEPRSYRPAMTAEQAARELRRDVRAGRLDTDAVETVLSVAGQPGGKRRSGPSGLTPRELEVLTLIARGASNRQVADALDISPKTAGTHIERIYSKIGVSTRSTAALYAMQHGLLESSEPFDS